MTKREQKLHAEMAAVLSELYYLRKAARRASVKMHYEYEHLAWRNGVTNLRAGECWAEVEALDALLAEPGE